ncbi:LysR substrate-binding domain-containing protein [Hydrogenophaga sp. PBL-H3]|uniref:LysR substrate-binding domain-containing protein n=1 Tax=Hydrogenophaga sp. PBL-H3 TaxID=434010 RepID=UPI00131FD533|nr:LysR substrate-binding domain-containing protein [Hydrogenophaga sp. PBL-H3]QHE75587.1 LysR family transcriptional regulator [Hydrogenophaga sp. PBL-H3]QHE80013.1 LysR family transcriptional regulator [Hydrogenophaga sp. PBL-H3]
MASIDRVLRSNIKLRHLQLLVALDQFRHLGRTAEFMAVSQPAVSKMLTEVESMLGSTLFERSTRGTEPTSAGRSLVRFARSVLADFERTRGEIAAVESGAAGRTRVGSMVVTLPVLLAQAVAQFKQLAPGATVLVEEGDLTQLLPKLRLGEIDLFVGRLEPGYAAPDLVTEKLFNEPMVAVVGSGHPLSRKKQTTWADLAAMPCVLPPPWASLRVKLEQQFFKHKLQPPADIIETASFLAISTFVQQRGAAAFVARSVGEHFEREGLFKVLKLPVPVDLPPVGLITVRGRPPTRITEQLMECLRRVAAER